MKSFKRIISLFSAFLMAFSVFGMLLPLNTAAAQVSTAYIFGTSIAVRNMPTTSSSATTIDRISHRQVNVLSVEGEWLNVQYDTVKNGEIVSVTGYVKNVSEWVYLDNNNPDLDFESQLLNFPESYHYSLRMLHRKYPNWKFIPDNVNSTFEKAVYNQTLGTSEMPRKQVQISSQPISWYSMDQYRYNWDNKTWQDTNGGWAAASKEIISYYMDPRNFLDETSVYMFLMQSYGNSSYSKEGLNSIVSGTFLDTDDFKNIILEAGRQSRVSPYVIASKIIQEQGTKGTSPLISGKYSGYEGYYNYFNFGASGGNNTAVIQNGLQYAKNNGWNSPSAAIIGGAKKYFEGYVSVGQDTYYYQDFNVLNCGYSHQYAQAIHDAYSKGSKLSKVFADKRNTSLYFRIPVYKSMPDTAFTKPHSSDAKNNYYINNISVDGLSPQFNRYKYDYTLNVYGNTSMTVNVPSTATLICDSSYALKKGNNNIVLTVKSQTGYNNYYTISVNASDYCTLTVNKEDNREGYWVKDGNGWWYYYQDADFPVFQWVDIGGKWYWFDEKGYMGIGIIFDGANYYYIDPATESIQTGWITYQGNTYLFDADGKMATNRWMTDNEGWYYLNSKGVRARNEFAEDSKGWCYLDENGRIAKNVWASDHIGSRYIGADGYAIKNTWHYDNQGWYYIDQFGYSETEVWKKDSVGWCYLGSDGKMVNSLWIHDGYGWRYTGQNGYLTVNSWIEDSVGWCYVGADGYCLTNTWKADKIGWCYLDSNGRMLKNAWAMDSKGWCYLDENGYLATNRWAKDAVGWYYLGADGHCVTNTWKLDSVGWCYLGQDGRMLTNSWVEDSVGWCYVGADGYCVTNTWMADSVGWCYLGADGRMVKNTWVNDSQGPCYIGSDGYMKHR